MAEFGFSTFSRFQSILEQNIFFAPSLGAFFLPLQICRTLEALTLTCSQPRPPPEKISDFRIIAPTSKIQIDNWVPGLKLYLSNQERHLLKLYFILKFIESCIEIGWHLGQFYDISLIRPIHYASGICSKVFSNLIFLISIGVASRCCDITFVSQLNGRTAYVYVNLAL